MARARTRGLLAVFPLTLRGIFLLALSLGILALGIIRTDMAGLFWGSSFLLASAYAVVGNNLMRLLASRRKGTPGFLEIHVPATLSCPADNAEASLVVTLPKAFIPGFAVDFRLPLNWHERNIAGVRANLSPGRNRMAIAFRAETRGSFTAAAALLEVRDILGFTSSAFALPVAESVKVFPRLAPGSGHVPVVQEGGDAVRYASRRRKSDELLEVRKYFPGDDVRKLNWKVFAHINELFLRIGEETPPPESRFLFILDSTSNPLVPPIARADYLDRVVEACASTMTMLLRRGMDLLFWWPSTTHCMSFTQESIRDLMAALSDVWWAGPGWAMELPARPGMHALVFSTPGSPSLRRIMAEIAGRGWKASLYLQELDIPETRGKALGIKSLLFIPPEEAGASRSQYPTKALRSFRDAMEEDSARYAGVLVGGKSVQGEGAGR